jgi:hypothetical protein
VICVLCDGPTWRREYCHRHYRWFLAGTLDQPHPWVNPLVCVCPDPDCDGIGECSTCHRKPLELLRRPS